VVDHVHQDRAGIHGAAIAGDEFEVDRAVQRGFGLLRAPGAIPAVDFLLGLAQLAEVGVHQIMGRRETMLAPFEVGLPDPVDHVDVVQRADHVLENRLALPRRFPRRQRLQAVEQTLIGPGLVVREQMGRGQINHRGSP